MCQLVQHEHISKFKSVFGSIATTYDVAVCPAITPGSPKGDNEESILGDIPPSFSECGLQSNNSPVSSTLTTGLTDKEFRSHHKNLFRKKIQTGNTSFVCSKAIYEKQNANIILKYFRCNMRKLQMVGTKWEPSQMKHGRSGVSQRQKMCDKPMQYDFCRGTLQVVFTNDTHKFESGGNRHSCGFIPWWFNRNTINHREPFDKVRAGITQICFILPWCKHS